MKSVMKLVMTVVYGFLITVQGSLSQNIITFFTIYTLI